jgi:hypothetical protein
MRRDAKTCDGAVLAAQLGTPRGRYDEHNNKFPSVVNTRFNRSFATAPDNLYGTSSRALLCTSSNVEPAHNTTKNFAPTYDEVVNLTGLL